MRCVPRDLARITAGPYRDRIVRVISLDPEVPVHSPSWLYEPEIRINVNYVYRSIWDASLQPIRDLPGDDEMLRIAGTPAECATRRLTRELDEAQRRLDEAREALRSISP